MSTQYKFHIYEGNVGGSSSGSGSSSSGTTTTTPVNGSASSDEQINRKYATISLNDSLTNGTLYLTGNVKSRAGSNSGAAFTPSYFTFLGIFDSNYNDITDSFIIGLSPSSQGTYIPASTSAGTPVVFSIKTKTSTRNGTTYSSTIPSSFMIRICLIRNPGYGCTITLDSNSSYFVSNSST